MPCWNNHGTRILKWNKWKFLDIYHLLWPWMISHTSWGRHLFIITHLVYQVIHRHINTNCPICIMHSQMRSVGFIAVISNSDITWASRRLTLPATGMFILLLVQSFINRSTKTLNIWSFVRWIHRWPVDSHELYHGVIMWCGLIHQLPMNPVIRPPTSTIMLGLGVLYYGCMWARLIMLPLFVRDT